MASFAMGVMIIAAPPCCKVANVKSEMWYNNVLSFCTVVADAWVLPSEMSGMLRVLNCDCLKVEAGSVAIMALTR